ncbi:ubiquitinyl hydrolase [Dothidotthia symphoricarpi CBS 119687]|uniref:Ubiquitin carboxyl-terminal hydrolase n=1 Tax=Dothidotthia symphoricarpi CBS 119687 TaxID=1392245 RepID=A0A6A6A235_9PLEO|nr:ubiquitinyl hydrolase [Dothidotthia symphoricarpi CBS 119687]KAF2124798.1 ubiquitinyl hydrolase [Dothidotthia symphoricarpi CBS 119687]
MSGGWNTIESDAGVFTYLIEKLGVKGVQFEDLLSLDASALQELGTVYGVIFLFKYPTGERPGEKPKDGSYDHEAANNLFFAAQTIQNACGTQALISVLLNKEGEVNIGKDLKEFKEFAGEFPPELRGETLSNSDLIRETHNSFARSSPFVDETQRTATEDDDVFHFIAYTSINNKLYELDGLQPAPILHGPCTAADFPSKVVPVLQRRVARYPDGEIRFNLMACVKDLRIRAREIGDEEELEMREDQRAKWLWENSLRRHNFVGFVGELLKSVVKAKLEEGGDAYDKWVEEAKGRSKKRAEDLRKQAAGGA